jgi:hypothetical protein
MHSPNTSDSGGSSEISCAPVMSGDKLDAAGGRFSEKLLWSLDFARSSLRTIALAPRLPPCPLGASKVHARFADRHPKHGCTPSHLVLRLRQASHAFETTFLAVEVSILGVVEFCGRAHRGGKVALTRRVSLALWDVDDVGKRHIRFNYD